MREDLENVAYIAMMGEIDVRAVESLIKTVSDVPKETDVIYLMLSTIGGSVSHGFAIYNFLRALRYKVVIHNIGNVDSIGNIIFLAGEDRYATENALFLYHKVKIGVKPKFVDMSLAQEKLDGIRKDEYRINEIYKARTRMTNEELINAFEIGEFKTAQIALENGIIHDIRNLPEITRVAVVDICQ